jgi:hypothetical protein
VDCSFLDFWDHKLSIPPWGIKSRPPNIDLLRVYSNRSASIGSSLAAVLAGQTPNTTPTSKLKPRASTTVSSFIAKTQSPRMA